MKIVVLGASGHVGNAIVRAFVARGDEVTACGRRMSLPLNLAGVSVTYRSGDAERLGQLDQWIEGNDIVVDAAAPYPVEVFGGGEGFLDQIRQAERRTRLLLNAVRENGVQLAFISSFVTMTQPDQSQHRLEAQVARLLYSYFETKRLMESQIVQAARGGTRAIIVNPSYCLGPWDLHDRRFCTVPLLLSGEIPAAISQALNVIDVRDVAIGVIAALEKKEYGVPILLNGHSIATQQLYSLICQLGGVRMPVGPVPSRLALLFASCMELGTTVMGRQALIPSGGMMMAAAFDWRLSGETMQQHLGITARPLEHTIRDAILWYREIGYC
jgi:dihydroflavonol-4-reductase